MRQYKSGVAFPGEKTTKKYSQQSTALAQN